MIELRKPSISDFFRFLADVRKEDQKEAEYRTGKDLLYIPLEDFAHAAVIVHKESGDILGMGEMISDWKAPLVANVWFLTTISILKHRIEFLKWSKKRRDDILSSHDYICNAVMLENTLHVKWLKWLGAVFLPESLKAPEGAFVIMRDGVEPPWDTQ